MFSDIGIILVIFIYHTKVIWKFKMVLSSEKFTNFVIYNILARVKYYVHIADIIKFN